MVPGNEQYTSWHNGVSPVQLPNVHVNAYSFSSITSLPVGPTNLYPSLHLNNARIPCSVFGARTMPNFGARGSPLQRAGMQRGIMLHVPLLHVGGADDDIGNS